ncbi:hypothetical protein DPMN_155962 [Dreissena polymorpha]|uniref:Uncharacterized protein n=1 Tax=Dreissena polymorpha TaxID=45954 RepID=A0A9D4FPT5_DREPO|nr:hypothetical protein DPMN_155962 [Dreissena polymorpha]
MNDIILLSDKHKPDFVITSTVPIFLGRYLYAEAGLGSRGDNASVVSPLFNTTSDQSIRFYYHIYSEDPLLTQAGLEKDSLFALDEEELLVNHLESLAQLNVLASELAVKLGKRNSDHKLSGYWYYNGLQRWDHRLKIIKPRALSSIRAAAVTQENIDNYHCELNAVLENYGLKSKPHLIYNLDETGIQPEHRPSKHRHHYHSIAIPPYYIFKGKRPNNTLMTNATAGVAYTMSDSRWVNGSGDNIEPILSMYDGHSSHWARQHHDRVFNQLLEYDIERSVVNKKEKPKKNRINKIIDDQKPSCSKDHKMKTRNVIVNQTSAVNFWKVTSPRES